MSSSTKDGSGSQNNSELPTSSRTPTAACSGFPQQFCTVPITPARWPFQWTSLTRTTVPLRASLACTSLYLLSFSLLLLSRQPTPGLPPARRFTVTVATSPFDSSWDQSGSSPPCRLLFGVGSRSPEKTRDLTPTAVPFPYKIYSRDLHLFLYSVALCGRRHPVQEARFKCMLNASNIVVSGHRSYWKQHRGAPYTITWSPPHISSVRLARNMQSVPASTTITRTEFIGKDGSAASLRRYVGGS